MLSFNNLGNLGRLGNQMFEYAALLGISRRIGTEICIPRPSSKELRPEHQLFDAFDLKRVKHVGRQADVPQVGEHSFAYDANLHNNCPKDADIIGYFQSEKYFQDIADEIREEFRFKTMVEDYCVDVLSRFKLPKISLHVRRGDYLLYSEHFPLCSLEYYAEALSRFPTSYQVLIFSDDIGWCRTQSIFMGNRFTFFENHPNFGDMCLMSNCDHHIIANSSFSWWGAWLGKNSDKVVIAPKTWFGEKNVHAPWFIEKENRIAWDTKDLIPPTWLRI